MTKEEIKKEITSKLGEIKNLFEQAPCRNCSVDTYEDAKQVIEYTTEAYRDEIFDRIDAVCSGR